MNKFIRDSTFKGFNINIQLTFRFHRKSSHKMLANQIADRIKNTSVPRPIAILLIRPLIPIASLLLGYGW